MTKISAPHSSSSCVNSSSGSPSDTTFGRSPRSAKNPASVSSTACGKAIIVGEHAVVYGARAVAMPLPGLGMKLNLKPVSRPGNKVRVTLGGRPVSDHLRGVVEDGFKLLGIEPFAADIEGQSSLLIGAGLGSSASLCIVTLRTLAAASGIELTSPMLAYLGNQLECRFHGNPSGLDTAVVAYEHLISFRKGETPCPLTIVDPRGPTQHGGSDVAVSKWRFALLDTRARSSTMAMIKVAEPYFAGPGGDARVRAYDDLAGHVTNGLAEGDQCKVAWGMNEASHHLSAAGVVTNPVREVLDVAREVGVPAQKPTGAGGGGCVLALLDGTDPQTAKRQLNSLRQRLGAGRVFPVEIGS